MTQASLFPQALPQVTAPAPLPDICRGRHRGNLQSEAANKRVHSTKNSVLEEIYRLIAASAGLTSKEIGSLLNKQLNTFSGRLRELKNAGRIEPTGAERDGCAVLRTKGTL